MTLELGDVIARIGGDSGGGGAAARRYVHEFGQTPIPADGTALAVKVNAQPGETVVATLEWDGPATAQPVVVLQVEEGGGFGSAFPTDGGGLAPVTAIGQAVDTEAGQIRVISMGAAGYSAIRLTFIVIPTIEEGV